MIAGEAIVVTRVVVPNVVRDSVRYLLHNHVGSWVSVVVVVVLTGATYPGMLSLKSPPTTLWERLLLS